MIIILNPIIYRPVFQELGEDLIIFLNTGDWHYCNPLILEDLEVCREIILYYFCRSRMGFYAPCHNPCRCLSFSDIYIVVVLYTIY